MANNILIKDCTLIDTIVVKRDVQLSAHFCITLLKYHVHNVSVRLFSNKKYFVI